MKVQNALNAFRPSLPSASNSRQWEKLELLYHANIPIFHWIASQALVDVIFLIHEQTQGFSHRVLCVKGGL